MIQRIDGVLCCGNVCYDIPVWPVEPVVWGRSAWVEEITFSVGGNGANTSYALATLGTKVRLTGIVGRDAQGDALVQMLADAGVQIDIQRTDIPTTSSVVLVNPSGDRSFLHRPGASRDLTPEAVSFGIEGYSHFHLANPFSLPAIRQSGGEILARAKAAELTTSLDTAWDSKGRWMEDIGPCLPHTDLLFVNDSEAKMLTGCGDPREAIEVFRRMGSKDVVVKLGARGCVVFADAEEMAVSGFAVDVKDTTGAGDCFVGGFLAALSRGLDYRQAAKVANAVGAMNVERLGAAQGVRPWDDTAYWLKERDTL